MGYLSTMKQATANIDLEIRRDERLSAWRERCPNAAAVYDAACAVAFGPGWHSDAALHFAEHVVFALDPMSSKPYADLNESERDKALAELGVTR